MPYIPNLRSGFILAALYTFTPFMTATIAHAGQTKTYPAIAPNTLERMPHVNTVIDANPSPGQPEHGVDVNPAAISRDTTAYFSKNLSQDVKVELRLFPHENPKSVAIFPKHYGWVSAHGVNGALITEGVVRITAVSKEKYKITHFIDKKSMLEHPGVLNEIFPHDLVPAAMELTKN